MFKPTNPQLTSHLLEIVHTYKLIFAPNGRNVPFLEMVYQLLFNILKILPYVRED